ncbi:hypothetical protein HUJ04_005868 [Dendroctonus ponderosae]|nr:hypothetical protein HUJ04_005868 [Dendroctonus ponderosae]
MERYHINWPRLGSLSLRKSRLAKENGVSIIPKPKHKDIQQWLKDLELEEYEALFGKYRGVEEILELTESELKQLGVKKSSHRATIISSLTQLRAKYYDDLTKKVSVRHSVAVDTSRNIQREDTL